MTKATHRFRVADLPSNRATSFDLRPTAEENRDMADRLGISGLRKVAFKGQITPEGKRDWRLEGHLGATVTQPCVVTLAPVTTRLQEDVTRLYLAQMPEMPEGEEIEMPEDDTTEPLPDTIDLYVVMAEALALALPLYPRAPDAGTGDMVVTEPGVEPLRDEDTKPFAGLAGLRDSLKKDD